MESQHSGHYTIYNVAERSYSGARYKELSCFLVGLKQLNSPIFLRYPGGNLVHVPWPAESVPPLDSLLDLLASILDYLSRDARNVTVIHCIDGKSSTAVGKEK